MATATKTHTDTRTQRHAGDGGAHEKSLPRAAYPEEAGVSSGAVLRLLEAFEESGLELHSLMILRHGKVAFECWRKPYGPDIPHMIYSFSKSVTATAVGFAIDEGLFSLESKLYEFFPEFLENPSPYAKELTIRHLLTMTSGMNIDVMQSKDRDDWVGDFLHSKFKYQPGTVFHYTNENAYILSVLIHKLTGQTLREYLTPRLFEPLGIDVPFWETDPQGREAGGWGIQWRTEDSAKFMQCYLDGGKFAGVQVIPAWWAEEATSKQVSNADNYKEDSKVGYGYQFWRCRLPNTFSCRGMFCQQGVAMRDYDACLVYTGSDADEQKPFDVLYDHFPDGFLEDAEEAGVDFEAVEALRNKAAQLSLPQPPASKRSTLERELNQETIRVLPQPLLNAVKMPTSFLPVVITQMTHDKAGHIDNIQFQFQKSQAYLTWEEAGARNQIPVGLDGTYREGEVHLAGFRFTTVSYGYWASPESFTVVIRPLESCSSRIFTFHFRAGGRVLITQASTPSTQSIAANLTKLAEAFLNNQALYAAGKRVLKLAPSVVEGRLKARRSKRTPGGN
ncbi:MAG: beta-lactamase family protein [Clostridiales bacterium]|nr:beta-lactamase family protein [Clostridiales bacterium]